MSPTKDKTRHLQLVPASPGSEESSDEPEIPIERGMYDMEEPVSCAEFFAVTERLADGITEVLQRLFVLEMLLKKDLKDGPEA